MKNLRPAAGCRLSSSFIFVRPFLSNRCKGSHFHNRQEQQSIYRGQATGFLRQYTSSSYAAQQIKSFEETALGKHGLLLLDGLDRYSVPAAHDGHPLAVYGISSANPIQVNANFSTTNDNSNHPFTPILLLHGRTWSSVPVYHLLGPSHQREGSESRSLMEALLAKGLQPYAMDFRGFGGTPSDPSGHVEPFQCVEDTKTVLKWIAERHGIVDPDSELECKGTVTTMKPALLGWSQGALIAQLVAQKTHSKYLSKLILYASIYDPLHRYPRDPLYTNSTNNEPVTMLNTYDAAIEDFTIEGTIPPEPAKMFAIAALTSDPVKAVWKHTYQFNNIDPARVQVPCLVIAGDQDPYAPMHAQQDLFCNLGRDSDRTWSILSGCDHAVHLLDGRSRLINIFVSFLHNDKHSDRSSPL